MAPDGLTHARSRDAAPAAGGDEARWSAWMAQAQDGDAEAYRQLLSELASAIEGYLRKQFGDAPWLEDCVQESLLALHRARHTYDPRRRFRPWMFTLVRHKAVDLLRGRGRRARHEVEAPEGLDAPAETLHEASGALDTAKLLADLEPAHREALELTKLRGYSIREAAQRAGVSEAAMKTRVHRAIRAARRLLEREAL